MVSVALMDPGRVVRDFADADSTCIELATLEAVVGLVGAGLGSNGASHPGTLIYITSREPKSHVPPKYHN